MIDTLVRPTVAVSTAVSVKPYNEVRSIPAIKQLLPLDTAMEGIDAIKMAEDIDLLAFWPGYGYATFYQLVGMKRIQEARHRFALVNRTVKWIDEIEWRIQDLRKHFEDTQAVTKSEYKSYVETINLGTSRVPGDLLVGHQLFDFRENLWLHTTSILVSMLALRDEYPGVGVISPSFHDFCILEQKRRTAGGLGAGNPEYTRVIGAMNVGAHWVAFFIDRKKKVRKMFDPLQSNVNYKTVKKSVQRMMEPILDLKDKVHFERIKWCMQQDGSSCGVWCLAILKMLVANATWDGCIYQLLPYLRMRYLYKTIAFVEKTAILVED
ncbi:hypothetical protein PI125_g17064 [Phytophthora idaei]|nr:hypothetical protein PI125_g17064 [Phytophthora idaei]